MNSRRPTLLIVDDSPTEIRLLGQVLGKDHDVRFATSGEEALTLIRRWPPDLVLLDLVMPEMNGHEVCRGLKADPATRHIPIIFITGASDEDNEVQSLEAGAADYISKPINVPILRTRIRNQLQLHQALTEMRLAASVFHNPMEGILVANPEKNIIDVNEAFCRMTGYDRRDLIGKNIGILYSDRLEATFYSDMWNTVQRHGHWAGEIWSRIKSGESHPQLLNLSRVQDDGGETSHFVFIYSDVRFLLDQSKRLEHLAYYDALTDLPNRHLLMDRLHQLVTQGQRCCTQGAVALLDLDGFKPVNDRFGHYAGDAVLIQIAERLKGILRASDTAGRLGGDEFVLILPDLNAEAEIENSLTRILQSIAEPIALPREQVVVTGSIGVAFYPRDGLDPDRLVRRADRAMYRAKAAGSNCFRIYDAESDGDI